MMFLFARHSAGLLSKNFVKQKLHKNFAQKPSSMAHEGNHICLHRFSFIYVTNGLWEDAYTCPINAVNCTTKSAIYVLEVICS